MREKILKIISWNINGLKSRLKSGFVDTILAFDADIICLQEIRSSVFAISGLEEYSQYFFPAQKPGYAGVGILSKTKPQNVQYGFGSDRFDREGRCITAEYDSFYLVSVYYPSLSAERITFREYWDEAFYSFITNLMESKAVIICGDMNTAHLDIDVYSPPALYETPGFTLSERRNFDRLLQAGLVDAFRLLHPRLEWAFSWWSYRGHCRAQNLGMRLDYCLVSSPLRNAVLNCTLRSEIYGSDHCPVELLLDETRVSKAISPLTADNVIPFPGLPAEWPSEPCLEDDQPTSDSTQLDSPVLPAISESDSLAPISCPRNDLRKDLKFTRYNYNYESEDCSIITRTFIILVSQSGFFRFTNFHRYIRSPREIVSNISQHASTRFDYIIPFLNYAFFECGIKSLTEITVEITQNYLRSYANKTKPDGSRTASNQTIKYCTSAIMDFLEIALRDSSHVYSMKREDLYMNVLKKGKHGESFEVKVPVFDIPVKRDIPNPLNRDIPMRAFYLLLDHIIQHHTDLLGMVMVCAFAGCRPAEGTNVRCTSSPLGPGIIFTEVNGKVIRIQLDLTRELQLRSDGVLTGRIKKERMQSVPDLFIEPFMKCYGIYEEYMSHRDREPEYMPFSVNRQGKAMTYDVFYRRFAEVVKEMIPIFQASDDPEIAVYGKILVDHPITPHIFRHYYTVQLVLSGITEPGELMTMRGDTSPESALTYLKNKGELEKQYSVVSNEAFDYLRWSADKQHEEFLK